MGLKGISSEAKEILQRMMEQAREAAQEPPAEYVPPKLPPKEPQQILAELDFPRHIRELTDPPPLVAEYVQNINRHIRDGIGLIVVGPPLAGKTAALAHIAVAAYNERYSVKYLSGGIEAALRINRLLRRIVQEQEELIDPYWEHQVVIIDDADYVIGGDSSWEALGLLLYLRNQARRPVCMAMRMPPTLSNEQGFFDLPQLRRLRSYINTNWQICVVR